MAPEPGAINHVVRCTLSKTSIGLATYHVKLLQGIISAFSPKMKLILHSRRMDPTGLEPAPATWSECYVAITPRAHLESP